MHVILVASYLLLLSTLSFTSAATLRGQSNTKRDLLSDQQSGCTNAWCENHPAPWWKSGTAGGIGKCEWESHDCLDCPQCDVTIPALPCKNFCNTRSYPWYVSETDGKCFWLNCMGCLECEDDTFYGQMNAPADPLPRYACPENMATQVGMMRSPPSHLDCSCCEDINYYGDHCCVHF